MNFNPSCTARLPPDPITGLAAATSGVAHSQPNEPVDGSFCPNPFWPPSGFAKFGRIGAVAGGLTGSGPTPAASVPISIGPQGCPLSSVTMELISQPSNI